MVIKDWPVEFEVEAVSGITAFILSRLLVENSSLTLAVAMLLVFSDMVLEAIEMDTPSPAAYQERINNRVSLNQVFPTNGYINRVLLNQVFVQRDDRVSSNHAFV